MTTPVLATFTPCRDTGSSSDSRPSSTSWSSTVEVYVFVKEARWNVVSPVGAIEFSTSANPSPRDQTTRCPVAIASDVIADRWTPLIIRELVLGNTRFNDIARGLPGISRSLLVQRLKHLERKGVIETWPSRSGRGSEYHLTPAGKDLEPVLIALGRWAVVWMYSDLDASDVDERPHAQVVSRHIGSEHQEVVVRPEELTVGLEGAARALDDASHDLRNSLGAIGNAVHYLDLVLPEDERYRRYLGLIRRELATTNRLVAGLLDVSARPAEAP